MNQTYDKDTNSVEAEQNKIEINMKKFKNMSDKDKDLFVDEIFSLLNRSLGYKAYCRWGNIHEEYGYIFRKIQDYLARNPDDFYNAQFIQFIHDNFFCSSTSTP